MSAFSTTRANEAFETTFTRPVKAMLQREIADSGRAYAEIGSLWLQAKQPLARLSENERHVPVGGATLKTDVQDAVAHRFTALVDELKPQVQRAAEAGGALTLHKRVSSINAGYEQAQLAAAANRAAVTAFQGLPVKHAMNPGAVTDAAVVTDPGENLLESLVLRMTNGLAGAGEQNGPKPPPQSGKDKAAVSGSAVTVSPAPARAADRLVSVGVPPLRVDPIGGKLALHLLKTKDTFTAWVESKQLQCAQLREALSIARALELATHWYGADYLAELPDDVLRSLSERLKLEMKLSS